MFIHENEKNLVGTDSWLMREMGSTIDAFLKSSGLEANLDEPIWYVEDIMDFRFNIDFPKVFFSWDTKDYAGHFHKAKSDGTKLGDTLAKFWNEDWLKTLRKSAKEPLPDKLQLNLRLSCNAIEAAIDAEAAYLQKHPYKRYYANYLCPRLENR